MQLPGVDDPARVKEIMQSTAMLEIRQAIGRTLSAASRKRLPRNGGVLPADTVLMKGRSMRGSVVRGRRRTCIS